jgi:hypothetical protein
MVESSRGSLRHHFPEGKVLQGRSKTDPPCKVPTTTDIREIPAKAIPKANFMIISPQASD